MDWALRSKATSPSSTSTSRNRTVQFSNSTTNYNENKRSKLLSRVEQVRKLIDPRSRHASKASDSNRPQVSELSRDRMLDVFSPSSSALSSSAQNVQSSPLSGPTQTNKLTHSRSALGLSNYQSPSNSNYNNNDYKDDDDDEWNYRDKLRGLNEPTNPRAPRQFATLQELFAGRSTLESSRVQALVPEHDSVRKIRMPVMKLSKDDWNVKCWEQRLASYRRKNELDRVRGLARRPFLEATGGYNAPYSNSHHASSGYGPLRPTSAASSWQRPEQRRNVFKDRIEAMEEKLERASAQFPETAGLSELAAASKHLNSSLASASLATGQQQTQQRLAAKQPNVAALRPERKPTQDWIKLLKSELAIRAVDPKLVRSATTFASARLALSPSACQVGAAAAASSSSSSSSSCVSRSASSSMSGSADSCCSGDCCSQDEEGHRDVDNDSYKQRRRRRSSQSQSCSEAGD